MLESLHDYVVCSFAVDDDFVVFLQDDRHALPVTIELNYVQYLILYHPVVGTNTELIVFIRADVLPTTIFGHIYEC